MINIEDVLKQLTIKKTGRYENQFYIIDLDNSDEFAKMYTTLEKNAVNTEFPNFGTNSTGTLAKSTHYFEVDTDGITYNIFLIGDFANDKYYLKIGEK